MNGSLSIVSTLIALHFSIVSNLVTFKSHSYEFSKSPKVPGSMLKITICVSCAVLPIVITKLTPLFLPPNSCFYLWELFCFFTRRRHLIDVGDSRIYYDLDSAFMII